MHVVWLHNKNPQFDTEHNFRLTLLARDVFDAFASSWREDMVRQKAPGWCFFRFFHYHPYESHPPNTHPPVPMWKFCNLGFYIQGEGIIWLFYCCVCVSVVLVHPCPSCIIHFHLNLWDGWAMLGDTECPWRFNSFVEAWAEFSQNHRGLEVQTCQIL